MKKTATDMRFARLSKKILMVLSLSHITQHMLQPEKNVKVGKKRTRIYFHLEDKGRDYYNKLYETYQNMSLGVDKIFHSLKEQNEE